MKATILLFAVILGYITPAYSQLNRHRKTGIPSVQPHNKKADDFGSLKLYKSTDFLHNRKRDIFDMSPTRPALTEFTKEVYSGHKMPCVHPKSGDKMPCFKPTDTFHMRILKPKDVIWGILW
jgi:hypothetical protein